MIKTLKRFADWLDRRFPSRVTITEEKFSDLQDRLSRCAKDAGGFHQDFMILNERITIVEKSLASIKEILSKGGASAVKTEPEKLRDSFIRGEFGRLPALDSIIAAERN